MSENKKTRSARGELVDFKLLEMKARLASQQPTPKVTERKAKIESTTPRPVYVDESDTGILTKSEN